MIAFNPAAHFHGKPCKRGHNGLRYIKGGQCVGCMSDRIERRRRSHVPDPRRSVRPVALRLIDEYQNHGIGTQRFVRLLDELESVVLQAQVRA